MLADAAEMKDQKKAPSAQAVEKSAASQAIKLMDQRHILPVPENYAIFYAYFLGINTELVAEIDGAIANGVPFNDSVLKNIYHKFIIAQNNQRLISDVTQGAQRALGEALRIVGEFGSQTNSYNADIDGYMKKISVEIEDEKLKDMVRGLISATASIKERGEKLNHKLEDSQKEIEQLKRNLDQVTQESQRDFLTGVYNRKALDQMLEEHIADAKAQSTELSVLMLDIDHFKHFNDKFGHLLGDEVLKIVSRAITYCVRGKDIVARYGGEEFCIVLSGTPLQGAAKVAENIRSTIASRDLKRKDTGESYGSITVSIGASVLRHTKADTVETLVRRADEALYRSKNSGRNRLTLENENSYIS